MIPGAIRKDGVTKKFLSSTPSVNVARLTYLLVCEAAGVAIVLSTKGSGIEVPIWVGLVGGIGVAGLFILVESLMRGFTLRGFSNATFGLGVGLLCAWLLTRVDISGLLNLAFKSWLLSDESAGELRAETMLSTLRLAFDVTLFASLGFIGAVLALRSNRDDFAFIIPYVRFRQDATTGQPVVVDTEAVIDGRVLAVCRAGFLHGRMIVPRFVLEELQTMAAATTHIARQRGQRGLECLQKMQESPDIQISIHDSHGLAPNETVHQRLMEVARLLGARLLTANENLNRVAKLQGVDVLNIFELDEALRPTVAVGDRLKLTLVRGGKEEHQGVGYLPDGTMIVVNHGVGEIGKTVEVTVISTLQTNAGTMVFADLNQG
ncbi:MAG: hypothetical protein J0M04_09005 [Verrucomicrobia bacterium]|nr:hypothetical protein [Verrucomicrobiota bacterium]